MNKNDYQGWTNYETWNYALWIDNDQGLTDYFDDIIENMSDLDDDEQISELADNLKDYIEENNPLADTADCYTDLLNAAISEINFQEIAEHLIEKE